MTSPNLNTTSQLHILLVAFVYMDLQFGKLFFFLLEARERKPVRCQRGLRVHPLIPTICLAL